MRSFDDFNLVLRTYRVNHAQHSGENTQLCMVEQRSRYQIDEYYVARLSVFGEWKVVHRWRYHAQKCYVTRLSGIFLASGKVTRGGRYNTEKCSVTRLCGIFGRREGYQRWKAPYREVLRNQVIWYCW